jgi:hypothetical protein
LPAYEELPDLFSSQDTSDLDICIRLHSLPSSCQSMCIEQRNPKRTVLQHICCQSCDRKCTRDVGPFSPELLLSFHLQSLALAERSFPLLTQLNRAWDCISCRTLAFASSVTITNVTVLQDSTSTLRYANNTSLTNIDRPTPSFLRTDEQGNEKISHDRRH